MKKSIALITSLFICLSMAGCSISDVLDKDTDSSKSKKEDSSVVSSAESGDESATDDNSKDNSNIDHEADSEPDESKNDDGVPYSNDISGKEFKNVFPFCDPTNGFVGRTAVELEANIAKVDLFKVKTLSAESKTEMKEKSDMSELYKFKMINPAGVSEATGGYAVQMTLQEETFLIFLGLSENGVTLEDAERYSSDKLALTYYAFGMEYQGNTVLVPLFVGDDSQGYYIVKPVMKLLGYDASNMADFPEVFGSASDNKEQGNGSGEAGHDVNINDSSIDSSNGSSDSSLAEIYYTCDANMTIDRVSVESYGTKISYNFVNNSSFPVWIKNAKISLNGTPLTDKEAFVYLAADANSSIADTFTIFDKKLKSGDKLTIEGMSVRTDNYKDVEPVQFSLLLDF